MSNEAVTDSAGLNGPAKEKAAPRKRTVNSTRATKKAAAEAPVEVTNVEVSEAVIENDEGQKVIAAPKAAPKAPRKSNMHTKDDSGAIGSRAADAALAKKVVEEEKPVDTTDKVALWSDRNIRWTNVGALVKGYNIVTKEAAEKWLKQRGVREATPEEVATYYGK